MNDKPLSKREIKRRYLKAEFGLADAMAGLMFDHEMERGDALRYLGL